MNHKKKITKRELKEVIKATLRVILNEMVESPKGLTGPYSVYSPISNKYYLAQKDENTGVYYHLHPDTGEYVPLGTEEGGIQVQRDKLGEITTTSAVTPLNLPTWVSRRGGSQRGLEGSNKLGYELTPIGKKEMNRKQDPI